MAKTVNHVALVRKAAEQARAATLKRNAEIIKARAAGVTLRDLADAADMSVEGVRKISTSSDLR